MPLISVIIPVWNGEQTIRYTIESVLNQTISDFEVIVINDGSQDLTLDIISKIRDFRLKVFSYEHANANVSRNRGLSHASGKYISFIDADDLWTPNKLEAQLGALQANPEARVAYSWTDYIDESGQFLRRGSYIAVNGDVYAELLLLNFLENGSNPLICKQAFINIGNFDESLTAAQDWDMWLRLAAHYHFVAVPSPQILYRVSTNSMSVNVLRLKTASLQVINRAFIQAPKSLYPLKRCSLANLYKYLLFKTLDNPTQRQRCLVASNFLWNAIINDTSLLGTRVIWKVLLTIAIVALLPPKQARMLLIRIKQISNISALLAHIQINPSKFR